MNIFAYMALSLINSYTFAMKGSQMRKYWQPQIYIFEEYRAILEILKSRIVNNGGHLGTVIEIFMNYSGYRGCHI